MGRPAIEERQYGENVERGHCKCCCAKWHPVEIKRKATMRRYLGPKYRLVWQPNRRCTCEAAHIATPADREESGE